MSGRCMRQLLAIHFFHQHHRRLAWQKRHGWPDINHVLWAGRDSGIRMNQVPYVMDDIRLYTNHYDHTCHRQHGEGQAVPKREPFVQGKGIWGTTCINGAVGVYGYPRVSEFF